MDSLHPLAADRAGWRYWRPDGEGSIEFGTLHGSAPGLATHFHAQDQITVVIAGRRSLRVARDVVDLVAGRCLCIPAGVPHASQAEPADVVGLIAFLPAGVYAFEAIESEIERFWEPGSPTSLADLSDLVRRHRREAGDASWWEETNTLPDEPVGRLAARNNLSREAFTRQFARARGMPPHAFRLAARLDRARRLLRTGAAVADIAAETGFADQSHFGRAFRRAFGVSPGRYRQA